MTDNDMNKMQKISRKILADRLKLQMGLSLEVDVDYHTLRAMSLQLRQENLQKLVGAEVSYLAERSGLAA